jgi:hypothetical protein
MTLGSQIDKVPYHTVQEHKPPTTSYRKADVIMGFQTNEIAIDSK